MNRILVASAAALASVAAITSLAAPAMAEQSRLSEIIFGKAYDDNVMALQVAPMYGHGDRYQLNARSANSLIIRHAQAQAKRDPMLQHALALRGISLHNVLRVETAADGGKIVYYR
ncbi:hypothetical protein [Neorhizobium sp. NCHU2750]|uniref:hypothetical protein n=1 Tax=Neorhizobium sp. NCHU2750 TaxID=1825976 RepID=UPI000E765219|nr:hypothetical protein NCHU2750_40470 [Neorhizobium sp. NCHU2750]